jgi:hypothetical protein
MIFFPTEDNADEVEEEDSVINENTEGAAGEDVQAAAEVRTSIVFFCNHTEINSKF